MADDVSAVADTEPEPPPCPGCSNGWLDLGKGTVAPCPHHRAELYQKWLKRELRGQQAS